MHNLPIVADETYENFVFDDEFVSFSKITKKVYLFTFI
jgi:aspartate/methionine/tyrosine aminotransferase